MVNMKVSKIPKVDVIKVAIPAAVCPYKVVGTAFAFECTYRGKDRAECDLSRCENLVVVDEKDLELALDYIVDTVGCVGNKKDKCNNGISCEKWEERQCCLEYLRSLKNTEQEV